LGELERPCTPYSVDSLHHGPFDALFKAFWRYLPEPILDLLVYLPRREYRRFRHYLSGIREVARGIVRRSIVKGDGRDIMSVLLRANDSEDPQTKLSDGEVVDQIGSVWTILRSVSFVDKLQDPSPCGARYLCQLVDLVLLGACEASGVATGDPRGDRGCTSAYRS